MREYQVRICEGLGVKFPGPTRQLSPCRACSLDGEIGPSFGHSEANVRISAKATTCFGPFRPLVSGKATTFGVRSLRGLFVGVC